jgi:hypothetical protein
MSELFDKNQTVAHEQIETTRDYLKLPRVQLHLGETVAARMISLADRLYVPRIVNGVIVAEDGGIPVVSLKTGESITHDAGLSAEQKQAILNASAGRYSDIDHLESLLSPKIFSINHHVVGANVAQKTDIDVGPSGYQLRGSPAILLNNQKVDREGYSSSTLPHELVHAGQTLKRPIRRKQDHAYMKEDAQAYNVQSKVLTGVGGMEAENTHMVSQAYEAWKQQGLSLDTEDEVLAFGDMLQDLGVPRIHPKQRKKAS